MNRLSYTVEDIQKHIFEEGGFRVPLDYLNSLSPGQLADLATVYAPRLVRELDEELAATVTITNGSSHSFNIGFPSLEQFRQADAKKKERYVEEARGRCQDSQIFLFKNRWVVPTISRDSEAADASERYADIMRDASFNRASKSDFAERLLESVQ